MHYRMPAGHKPYLPQSTDPTGRVAGLCAVIILAALILLSLLAVDRVASTPAAHPAPAHMEQLEDPHHEALVAGVVR